MSLVAAPQHAEKQPVYDIKSHQPERATESSSDHSKPPYNFFRLQLLNEKVSDEAIPHVVLSFCGAGRLDVLTAASSNDVDLTGRARETT